MARCQHRLMPYTTQPPSPAQIAANQLSRRDSPGAERLATTFRGPLWEGDRALGRGCGMRYQSVSFMQAKERRLTPPQPVPLPTPFPDVLVAPQSNPTFPASGGDSLWTGNGVKSHSVCEISGRTIRFRRDGFRLAI